MNSAAQRVLSERLGLSDRNAAAAGSFCSPPRPLAGAADATPAWQQSGVPALRELLETGLEEDDRPGPGSDAGRPGAAAGVEEPMGSLRSPEEAVIRVRLREQLAEEELRREELIQSKQLSAVGSLAAGVAHEIRNPLAAMMNAVSLLHEGAEPGSEERQLTGIILEESRRMNRIVGEFLFFTRPSSSLRPTARIGEVIRSTFRLLEWDPSCASDVELSLEIEDGLPGVVADRDRVRQVLWNLLLNAVQAVGERGRVVVAARTESRDGRPGVAITVDDSGPGIPPSMRQRVFAPFETTKPNGTGLGLSLVRHIVDSYAGAIRIAGSGLGGARVWLWLACDRKREPRGR